MKKIEDFNLKENPFQYLTANIEYDSSESSSWYGLPDLKNKIDGIYEDLVAYKPRQVVLNWGPYGGGKTFTSYHFLKYRNETYDINQIYIRSPKQGNKAGIEFYKSIINYLTYRKIKKQINHLMSIMGEDSFFEFLHARIRSEELTEALMLVGSDDESIQKTMQRYIYEGLTKTELKSLGLAKNIDWGTDSIKFLSGIFHCFIGDQSSYKGKLVLWIDEMEDMIYYSQKEYRSFSQVLRDLMDSVNQHFCVFLNFTLAESEESTIAVLLGEALWSRITRKIRFRELIEEDALIYCKESLEHNQIVKSDDYNPFSEDILKNIFDLIPSENLTPREINRYCGGILQFAMKKEVAEIDINTVQLYFETIEDDE